MARLSCSRSGWGSVLDPERDEYVPLDSDVSNDVALRLADEYGPVRVVELDETGSGSDESEPLGGDSSDETEDGYTCVGNDGGCSRTVDEEGGHCWQHEE